MGRLDISAAEIERVEQEDAIVADSIPELLGEAVSFGPAR